jgi:hypothetical protein
MTTQKESPSKKKEPLEEIMVKDFRPSRNGFKFPNRFPGVPLPDVLEKLIDTSKSVHGLCGGMCYTVIDAFNAGKLLPETDSVPNEETKLYQHLAKRQWASWGFMDTQVLRYVHWMTLSDAKAQAETHESFEALQEKLSAEQLTVIGLVYHDIRETLRVWDNHQVLAHGCSHLPDGSYHIHVYDPNYPRHDDVYIEARPIVVERHGGEVPGLECAQYRGEKKLKDVHGFLVVPYHQAPPPADWSEGSA